MINPDAAWQVILGSVKPLEPIVTPLTEALGHCLAEAICADRDLPPTDRSAMDGYAVRSRDLVSAPVTLRLLGEVPTGSPFCPQLEAGGCVRIFTGACLPPGADAVVEQEQTEERDGAILFRRPVQPGANIFRRGEDARKDDVLLQPGRRLSAADIGILATVGASQVRVHRRPRVRILCTGTELLPIEETPAVHQVRNALGPALAASLHEWGAGEASFGIAPDDLDATVAALRRAVEEHDVVLITGGVSVGRYDFVRQALLSIGAQIHFHGVAMKPGKPSLFAKVGEDRWVFGLPGNPLSALTAFHEFALPAIRRLSGVAPESCRVSFLVRLVEATTRKAGRRRYQLARCITTEHGLGVLPIASHSSGDLPSAASTDGVILLPAGEGLIPAGEMVAFRPWRPLP